METLQLFLVEILAAYFVVIYGMFFFKKKVFVLSQQLVLFADGCYQVWAAVNSSCFDGALAQTVRSVILSSDLQADWSRPIHANTCSCFNPWIILNLQKFPASELRCAKTWYVIERSTIWSDSRPWKPRHGARRLCANSRTPAARLGDKMRQVILISIQSAVPMILFRSCCWCVGLFVADSICGTLEACE